jgi:hypothetical protein
MIKGPQYSECEIDGTEYEVHYTIGSSKLSMSKDEDNDSDVIDSKEVCNSFIDGKEVMRLLKAAGVE